MTDTDIEITREDSETKGRYVHRAEPNGPAAELTFSKLGAAAIIIDHTGVPDVFRGRGVGTALVARAVADARRDGVRITPLCPYAAAQFRRHPEWSDTLA